MKNTMKSKLGAISAVAVLLLAGIQSASAAESAPPSQGETLSSAPSIDTFVSSEPLGPPEGATVMEAPAEYRELLDSGLPMEITVNGKTGEVVSVEEASTISPLAVTASPNTCPTISACWSSYTPYVPYGFYGTGTVRGSWPGRYEFRSNVREAQICWTATNGAPETCSWRLSPHYIWQFVDATGVGKQVTLF